MVYVDGIVHLSRIHAHSSAPLRAYAELPHEGSGLCLAHAFVIRDWDEALTDSINLAVEAKRHARRVRTCAPTNSGGCSLARPQGSKLRQPTALLLS